MQWLFKLCSMLPLRVLQLIGAGIGGVTFKLSKKLRERTKENLQLAGYTNEQLPEKIGRNIGRQSLESLWVWYRPAETVLKKVKVTPLTEKLIKESMESGRPIVFMTPHVGCFEVLPVWLAATFYERTKRKISILYRPPRNPILLKIVGEAREAPGIEACPTNISGIKRIIKSLKAGHTFGALPDQVPSFGQGFWVDFFGKPAYTMTLPVKVAKQFDAIRIFAWAQRDSHGWTLNAEVWDEPLTGDMPTDLLAMNRRIESIIRKIPEQYAWSYNRYKHVSGTPPRPH